MTYTFPLDDIDRRLSGDALFGEHIYAVGGRVRDHFTNLYHRTNYTSKDFDYVIVGLSLEDVRARLSSVASVHLVGASFASLRVILDGRHIDIALARRETSTGLGHRDFEIDFGPEVTIFEDAGRRDFACNMLSVHCRSGIVFDPHGGLQDISRRTIRCITRQALAEDPLRMLRAVQFASRFGFTIDADTYAAIVANADHVATCSAERHQEELNKLVGRSPQPSRGFDLMRQTGLLAAIIPEMLEGVGMEQNVFHDRDVFGHLMAAVDAAAARGGDLIDRYAAVFHDIGKPRTRGVRSDGQGYSFHGHETAGAAMVRRIFSRLRFSDQMTHLIAGLTQEHMYACRTADGRELSDGAIRRFITKVQAFSGPVSNIEDTRSYLVRQFSLRSADRQAASAVFHGLRDEENASFEARVFAELDRAPALSLRNLSITGTDVIHEIIAAGARPASYTGDRLVREILAKLLSDVIETPALNTPESLKSRCRDLLDFTRQPIFAAAGASA